MNTIGCKLPCINIGAAIISIQDFFFNIKIINSYLGRGCFIRRYYDKVTRVETIPCHCSQSLAMRSGH